MAYNIYDMVGQGETSLINVLLDFQQAYTGISVYAVHARHKVTKKNRTLLIHVVERKNKKLFDWMIRLGDRF